MGGPGHLTVIWGMTKKTTGSAKLKLRLLEQFEGGFGYEPAVIYDVGDFERRNWSRVVAEIYPQSTFICSSRLSPSRRLSRQVGLCHSGCSSQLHPLHKIGWATQMPILDMAILPRQLVVGSTFIEMERLAVSKAAAARTSVI